MSASLYKLAVVFGRGMVDMTYAWRRAGHEDKTAQVCRAFVAQSASGIDQSANTIGLNCATNERRTPCGGGGGSLLRLQELLLRIRGLSAVIGITEDWSQDG